MEVVAVAVAITARGLDMTEALREYVERKIGRAVRLLNDASGPVQVTLRVERGRQRAEATVAVGGLLLRAEHEGTDLYQSLDAVADKLERQVQRWRERRVYRPTRAETAAPPVPEPVRTKHFAVKPMSLDEAVWQMEMLDHSFYVYLDADVDEMRVLYRRHDGTLGLLCPER